MKTSRLLPVIVVHILLFACNNPQSKNPQTPTSAKVNIHNHDVNIAYADTGNGDTTLLFVHGWCINQTYWASQVAQFGKKYRVVTMDLAGYGQSGSNRKKWDTDAFAGDVNAVIDQLKLQNVILIGHSMSGDIVLQAAINAGEKVIGVVGVDNFKSQGAPPQTEAQKKEMADAIAAMKQDFKKVAFQWFNEGLFSKTTSKPIKERILNDVAHADTVAAVASMAEQSYDELLSLVKWKKKLYLINSDYQPTDTGWLVKNKIPFMLLQVHGTGHFPMVEAPTEFNQLLGKVLADMNL